MEDILEKTSRAWKEKFDQKFHILEEKLENTMLDNVNKIKQVAAIQLSGTQTAAKSPMSTRIWTSRRK